MFITKGKLLNFGPNELSNLISLANSPMKHVPLNVIMLTREYNYKNKKKY
jgi:hypothetical protein